MKENRLKLILDLLNENEFVTSVELTETLGVTHMTVIRYLNELEERGYLIRKHGGAIKSEATGNLFNFSNRLIRNSEQKDYICKLAAEYIDDGDTIFIDCGSTLFRLCKYIAGVRNLRIITNSLPVLSEFANDNHVKVVFIGGEFDPSRKANYGQFAESMIDSVSAQKAFIGADGVSLAKGLSFYDDKEAGISLKMASNANKVFLLCDSSKIESDSYTHFTSFDKIDFIITDNLLEQNLLKRYNSYSLGFNLKS